jgi:hypothetical protein
MRATLQRLLAVVTVAVLAGLGLVVAATWSPTTAGLISAASAQEDDDDDDGGDDDDDDGAQVPVGGVATGQGGSASSTGDDDDDDDDGAQVPVGGVATGQGGSASSTGDDDDDDDDGAQVPVGGVATGQGGTAESWTAEPVGNDRSTGGTAGFWLAPLAALAGGGVLLGRWAFARLGGRSG